MRVVKELRAKGQLFSAERQLRKCPATESALVLLAGIQAELGNTKAAEATLAQRADHPLFDSAIAVLKMQLSRKIEPTEDGQRLALVSSRQALLQGNCSEAFDLAVSDYWSVAPNVEAALLAARSAECLGASLDAATFFARASYELERSGSTLGWVSSLFGRELTFDVDATLSAWVGVGQEYGYRVAGRDEDGLEWSLRKYGRLPGDPYDYVIVASPTLTVVRESAAVSGRNRETGRTVWRVPLGDGGECLSAFGAGQLFQYERIQNDWGTRWRRIDVLTGHATPFRLLRDAAQPQVLVASPGVSWVVLHSPSPAFLKNYIYVIDRSGKTAKWETKNWPEFPMGAWSNTEVAYDHDNELWAIDVWTGKRRRLMQPNPGIGRLWLQDPTADKMYFASPGGIGELRRDPATDQLIATILEPKDLASLHAVHWSPNHRHVAGYHSNDRLYEVWDLNKRRLEFSLPVRDEPVGTVSRDGRKLALSSCDAMAELDFESLDFRRLKLDALDCNRSVVTPRGLLSLQTLTLWKPVQPLEKLGATIGGNRPTWANVAGDWLAVGNDKNLDYLLNVGAPNVPITMPSEHYSILGFDSLGRHAIVRTSNDKIGITLDVVKLPTPPKSREARVVGTLSLPPSPIPYRALLANDASYALAMADDNWHELRLPDGPASRLKQAPWLEFPIQLAADGKTALLPSGTSVRDSGKVTRFQMPAAGNRLPAITMLGFAYHDKIAVGVTGYQVGLWRVADGSWLGQLLPVGDGWAFTVGSFESDNTTPLEPLGDSEVTGIFCVARDRIFPWRVCADRMTVKGQLREALNGLL